MITITPKDALKAKTLPPGWLYCKVTNFYMKPSEKDGSSVYYYELTVVLGEFKGVPLQEFMVSEKAPGMGKAFFIATGMPADMWTRAEQGESIQFDESAPLGKVLRVMNTPEKFGNRTLNKAGDFLKNDKPELEAAA